jgi:hypothetical protein
MHDKGTRAVEPAGHSAEPEAGSLRTADGREADLFTLTDYPIDAICQVCRDGIRARSFMLPFEHLTPGTGRQPGACAGQRRTRAGTRPPDPC